VNPQLLETFAEIVAQGNVMAAEAHSLNISGCSALFGATLT